MKTVTVNASVRYDVLIEKRLLSHCGEKTAEVFSPQKSAAAIITDDNVSALYLNTVVRSFEQAGFRVCHFTFLHGEDSKSHAVLMNVYDFLIQNHITRSDFIVALGGGVVGDLAGFAAATYLRSIPFIILMVAMLPVAKFVVGTSLGNRAVIVTLVIAAAPYVARMVESAAKEVNAGVIEAAQSMGASTLRIIWKVIIPEAKPALITGGVISTVTILGYSAMAGTIGGGGLGQIAITYGYQKYDDQIVWLCVALTILIVQILQEFGMYIARRTDRRAHS